MYRTQYEDDKLISRPQTKVGKLWVNIDKLKFENKNSKKCVKYNNWAKQIHPTIAFQFKYRYKFEAMISVRIHWVEDTKQQFVRQPLNFLTTVCDRTKF